MDDWLVLELVMDNSLQVQVVHCRMRCFCIAFTALYQYSHESSCQQVKDA